MRLPSPQLPPDEMSLPADPLYLDLNDDTLLANIRSRIKTYQDYLNKFDYPKRRETNRNYLLGQQVDKNKLKAYQAWYIDNLISEGESSIKPIAMSRMPDLLSKPGNETEEAKISAETITDIINSDIKKRENRKLLSIAHKHLPVFFTSCLKVYWDKEADDYAFKIVHPENIVFDPSVSTNDVDQMEFFGEYSSISVKELVMMFPKKKKDLFEEAMIDPEADDYQNKMASKLDVLELWFDWPEEARNEETGETEYEMVSGVCWKYKNLILHKMKNPYWDWEGKKILFNPKMEDNRELTDEEVRQMLFKGEEMGQETVFRNHLLRPSKPFYLMGYDQFGEGPLDATSRIEQVISQQDNVNKRGRQITEMNDRAKPKHIFNSKAISKPDVENMDLNDYDEDIMVDGDVNGAHAFILSPPAPAQLTQDQENERRKVFQKMGVNDTTRGVRGDQETLGGRQLLREADYGKIDDLVEDTINPAAEWQANWILQMIKRFYTKDHMRKLVGEDGEVTFARINQDMVFDGTEVTVTASGVDKTQKKREAFEMVKMKLIDPLTFYQDIGASDPIGRSLKLLDFMSNPELYRQKYVLKQDDLGMAQALMNQPVPGADAVPPQSPSPMAPPQAPAAPPVR